MKLGIIGKCLSRLRNDFYAGIIPLITFSLLTLYISRHGFQPSENKNFSERVSRKSDYEEDSKTLERKEKKIIEDKRVANNRKILEGSEQEMEYDQRLNRPPKSDEFSQFQNLQSKDRHSREIKLSYLIETIDVISRKCHGRDTSCSYEDNDLHKIECLSSTPTVNFHHIHSNAKSTNEKYKRHILTFYSAQLTYNVTMMRLKIVPKHCQVTAYFFSLNGQIGTTDFTVGLGRNDIQVFLVHNDRSVVQQNERTPNFNDNIIGINMNVLEKSTEWKILLTNSEKTGVNINQESNSYNKYCPPSEQQCIVRTLNFHLFRNNGLDESLAFIFKKNISRGKVLNYGDYHVCSLLQSCKLLYLAGESNCGLQHTAFKNWNQFKIQLGSLDICNAQQLVESQWYVPCLTRCDLADIESCKWSLAKWQPRAVSYLTKHVNTGDDKLTLYSSYSAAKRFQKADLICQFTSTTRQDTKSCFISKKVIFFGDSTNRGIMHYIMEKLNGSLNVYKRTKDTRSYKNLNDGRTNFIFSYYPKFWDSQLNTTMLDQILFHLLKILNLTNIRVIIKSLGSGFHRYVKIMHQLNLVEQQRLSLYNVALVEHAHQLGFRVVDTFNMTMSRFADFLEGTCSCHFHRVRKIIPSRSKYTNTFRHLTSKEDAKHKIALGYHVEGDINAAYSELVIKNICD